MTQRLFFDAQAVKLLQAIDWGGTPLGPPDRWPDALKTLAQLVAASPQPMFLCWGPDRTLIYNDSYAEILADKHPAALGRDLLEVWSEIREDLSPIVEEAYAGRPVRMADITLVMHRRGHDEEAHFSFSYTPVRDASGEVGGFFCACEEITDQVKEERRVRLRADLTERLRDLNDAAAVIERTNELLGAYFDADCVGFAEIDPDGETYTVRHEWRRPDFPSVIGRHRLNDFGPSLIDRLKRGETVAIEDVRTHPLTRGHDAAFEAVNVRALLDAPLLRSGQLVLTLFVLSRTARRWLAGDVELARQKAERTWQILERVRADKALREEHAFLEAIIETAPIGISITREPLDLPPIINREARRLLGVEEFVGDLGRYQVLGAVHRDGTPYATEDYPTVRALRRGETIEDEPMTYRRGAESRRWLVNSKPLRAENDEIISVITTINDIEDRLRAEEAVLLVNTELRHRVKNLFAIIRSLVALTGRDETDVAALKTKLLGRIDALAAAHMLSVEEEDRELVDLAQIVRAIVAPYDRQLHLEGPAVQVPVRMVTPLGLILHELATNAAKYGAWAREGGDLTVSWRWEATDVSVLRLEWSERWARPVPVDPGSRAGFGTKLMRSSALQLDGELTQRTDLYGLHTIFVFPCPEAAPRGAQQEEPA
ncbi:HWE histidine kinase domain-containing protein [Parvularcula dongshanensis]|uniref:histidine kinase n=1 Tax=Parvularcula dongshanensis TaxID=1173995 RepID=A0A840HYC8_9PROT|nr:HWE histidine kinase domain-containing protein [Parvularcula dongshanensis]MBB4657579.1 two-component sensor histidine kinase [Parvularcula dongshanensis]